MRTLLLGFWLVLACALSHAQGWNTARPGVAVQTGARSVAVTPGAMVSELIRGSYVPKSPPSLLQSLLQGRTYAPGPAGSGNGTVIDGLRNGPGPTSAGVEYRSRRAVAWASTAKAASRALPLIGTALVVKDLFDEIRCQEKFGGGAECDAGVPREQIQSWTCSDGGPPERFSVSAASCIDLLVADRNLNNVGDSGQPGNNQTYMLVTWSLGPCSPLTPAMISCEMNFVSVTHVYQYGLFQGISNGSGSNSAIAYAALSMRCPAVPSAGILAGSPVGRDGLCPTGEFAPVDYPQVEEKIVQFGDKARAPALLPLLGAAGIPIEHPSPSLEGPAVIQGGRETITRPDGSTTTRDTEHPMRYLPDGYSWDDRVTQREWGPGVTPEPQSAPPGTVLPPGTTTTTTGSPAAPVSVQVETCGLPGKPPCKIDETGTPSADPTNPEADAADATTAVRGAIAGIGQYVFPAMAWDFALPSTCTPIPASGFSEFFANGIDICPHQPMFHDVMSVVWWLGGLFGAIGLFWRDQLAGT